MDIDRYIDIYSESLFIALYIEIKHKSSKKFFRKKRNVAKMHSFFRELKLVTDLLLIRSS